MRIRLLVITVASGWIPRVVNIHGFAVHFYSFNIHRLIGIRDFGNAHMSIAKLFMHAHWPFGLGRRLGSGRFGIPISTTLYQMYHIS